MQGLFSGLVIRSLHKNCSSVHLEALMERAPAYRFALLGYHNCNLWLDNVKFNRFNLILELQIRRLGGTISNKASIRLGVDLLIGGSGTRKQIRMSYI